MKKIFSSLFAALVATSLLTGCQYSDRINLFTSVQNPISNDDFYYVKAVYASLALPVANYRELPLCKKSKPFSFTNICAKYSVIVKLQEYDNIAYNAISKADQYIASNQTLNLGSVVSAAKLAVDAYKNYALANGIKL